jgi:hypothetical protein
MSGQASRIMAGSDQEIQAFLTFGLEKGGMTIKKFNETEQDPSKRVEYIKDALINDSINKKFSSEFGSTRLATVEDVQRIKAANPSSTIKVGQEIRFSIDKQSKVEPEETSEPTQFEIKVEDAIKIAPETLENMTSPKSVGAYYTNKKIGGKTIINARIKTSTSEVKSQGKTPKTLELDFVSGSTTAGGERTEFTDTMKFDLNNPTRVKTLIDLLPDSDILKKQLKDLLNKKSKNVNQDFN